MQMSVCCVLLGFVTLNQKKRSSKHQKDKSTCQFEGMGFSKRLRVQGTYVAEEGTVGVERFGMKR
jgi:hypothetical protein